MGGRTRQRQGQKKGNQSDRLQVFNTKPLQPLQLCKIKPFASRQAPDAIPPCPPLPARLHEFPIAGQGRGRVGGFTSANDELVAPVARAQGRYQNVCVRRLPLDHHRTLQARHTHNTRCPLKPLLVRSLQTASRDRQTRSIHAHRTRFRARADRQHTSSPAPFSVASVGIPQSCGSATGRREGDA